MVLPPGMGCPGSSGIRDPAILNRCFHTYHRGDLLQGWVEGKVTRPAGSAPFPLLSTGVSI